MDFAADTKAAKKTARQMIRMLQAINGEHLARLAERADPNVSVTCATCHRGITRPRSLIDELVLAYRKGGATAAAVRFASCASGTTATTPTTSATWRSRRWPTRRRRAATCRGL